MKICKGCKKEFEPKDSIGKKSPIKKFCTSQCRKAYHKEKVKSLNLKLNLHSAAVGAIGELRVCVDLLLKGFQVFRNVCASGVDLVIWNKNEILTIEVVTGSFNSGNKISHNKSYRMKKWDHLAVVLKTGEVVYEPPLP